MRTVTIIASSPEHDLELIRREACSSHLVLCADGGYSLCCRAGLIPHVVVGDLDSIAPHDLALLEGRPIEVLRHPRDKDESDLELTLLEAHRRGAKIVRILAALGGRLDHSLFNLISILLRAHELALDATLVSSTAEARLLIGSSDRTEVLVSNRKGWTCSLIPLTDRVDGITLKGFQYPLEDEPLHQRETRGLSNVVTSDRSSISVGSGRLLSILIPSDAV
jgi:thiamine pyrophosphokinase